MSSETAASSSILEQSQSTVQEHMSIIEKRTEVNPKVIIGGLLVALILTTTKWFSSYVTCLVGVLCPTYLSLKAIEGPDEDDDKQYLTYWVVYGLFSVFDLFTAFLIKVIPFYYTIKLAFLIWLFMPNFKGAVVIYNFVVGPLFRKYESKFDKGVDKIIRKGEKITEQAKEAYEENKSKIIKEATKLRKKNE
jgi:receptor expression-enhancing protein 5/6